MYDSPEDILVRQARPDLLQVRHETTEMAANNKLNHRHNETCAADASEIARAEALRKRLEMKGQDGKETDEFYATAFHPRLPDGHPSGWEDRSLAAVLACGLARPVLASAGM